MCILNINYLHHINFTKLNIYAYACITKKLPRKYSFTTYTNNARYHDHIYMNACWLFLEKYLNGVISSLAIIIRRFNKLNMFKKKMYRKRIYSVT